MTAASLMLELVDAIAVNGWPNKMPPSATILSEYCSPVCDKQVACCRTELANAPNKMCRDIAFGSD